MPRSWLLCSKYRANASFVPRTSPRARRTRRCHGLKAGDRFAELGTGTGYGAALASHVVGPGGTVYTIEIDEALARRAARLLAGYGNLHVSQGDAGSALSGWAECDRVSVTFAVDEIPHAWVDALPEGGRLVAPVGRDSGQRLVRLERSGGAILSSDHGAVRYVRNRSAASPPSSYRSK
jgi:protein-L-isoaspartate(D-aspartate) O-methyltransferase